MYTSPLAIIWWWQMKCVSEEVFTSQDEMILFWSNLWNASNCWSVIGRLNFWQQTSKSRLFSPCSSFCLPGLPPVAGMTEHKGNNAFLPKNNLVFKRGVLSWKSGSTCFTNLKPVLPFPCFPAGTKQILQGYFHKFVLDSSVPDRDYKGLVWAQ